MNGPAVESRSDVRPLRPQELRTFKEIRLRALRTEPGVYGSSYESTLSRTDEAWRSMLEAEGQHVFGAFAETEVCGIGAVFAWDADPWGTTAILAMDYVDPRFRGRGWSHRLMEARLGWIGRSDTFRRVVISHRASNEPMRRTIVRYGFTLARREPHRWHDGADEDELWYELRLR